MSTTDGEGFLSRWSRRKALARAGAPLPPQEPPAPAPGGPAAPAGPAATAQDLPPSAPAEPTRVAAETAEPLPTLEDVQRLTPDADFRPFVRPQVPPEVRNAALRKLFSDPHFNQMDGLDVYIDDYSKPDPLPAELARRMVAAQFMRLFDEPRQDEAGACARTRADATVSGTPPAASAPAPAPAAAAAEAAPLPPAGAADTTARDAAASPLPEPSVTATAAVVLPSEPAR
ncbi:hypothetical protein Tsedi_01494 [Tepidimonas sediminis]|uniref:DUF3306 domain-containing protein n=1 Tax=Tepidimonas sediminis TaxID=2588941 RepID=A0A554WNU9_9BURK|nr:DUF3306 domain-containing protein [Tepidimonas sediminis]TSE25247.1 hypothetical protein Tsedi_01494 [Tepidimonas sediminis]